VLERLAAAAAAALASTAAAVWLLDAAGERLLLAAGHGLPFDAADESRYVPGASESAWRVEIAFTPTLSAGLCVPIGADDRPTGVLCIYNAQPRQFTCAEIKTLRALAAIGATVVPLARRLVGLEDAEVQRAKLLRVTTHELRSPITVAQSLLRNVLRGYAGPLTDLQRDIFGRVANQLDFLGTLVNDFLDLTASRAATADEGPVAVNVSLARVVLILQPRAEEKSVTLAFRQAREELAVWATEEALDHIFTNLVDNAVKYTPPGGAATVGLARVGDQAQVTITDTGIGIPAESLPHLFEEFYRAPNARAFKAVGTGLGLAIVKGLVERYRGKIVVESTVGQGTTFTVMFPLYCP
jgi:signal transduction histidine kinase